MNDEVQLCQWYVMCDQPATKTRPHLIVGDVPICDRCDAAATAHESNRS